jgi:hypothetical protein
MGQIPGTGPETRPELSPLIARRAGSVHGETSPTVLSSARIPDVIWL